MIAEEEATETAAPIQAEEAPEADERLQPEPPPQETAWAFRTCPYDPAELKRTASLLGMEPGALAALCCGKAGESAQIALETDAMSGEVCFLPPEAGDACLWVGYDRLALCWNPRAMTPEDARSLLRETAARLALPARLILDRNI